MRGINRDIFHSKKYDKYGGLYDKYGGLYDKYGEMTPSIDAVDGVCLPPYTYNISNRYMYGVFTPLAVR